MGKPAETTAQYGKKRSFVLPVLLFVLSLLYDVSPLDLIPDVPGVGWIDDFFLTVTAGLYLVQRWSEKTLRPLSLAARYLKWGVLVLGILVVLLLAAGLLHLFG